MSVVYYCICDRSEMVSILLGYFCVCLYYIFVYYCICDRSEMVSILLGYFCVCLYYILFTTVYVITEKKGKIIHQINIFKHAHVRCIVKPITSMSQRFWTMGTNHCWANLAHASYGPNWLNNGLCVYHWKYILSQLTKS